MIIVDPGVTMSGNSLTNLFCLARVLHSPRTRVSENAHQDEANPMHLQLRRKPCLSILQLLSILFLGSLVI